MLTAEVALTERQRDLIAEQLRGFLESVYIGRLSMNKPIEDMNLTEFDEEEQDKVKEIQEILVILRQAF